MQSDTTESKVEAEVEYPPLKFRVLMSAFLVFYLFCITVTVCPQTALRNALYKPIYPFLAALGFWQSWNVFAPNIRTDNFHLLATVTFEDGTTALWEFPRQDLLTGVEQMRAERFRKWSNDRIRYHEYKFLQPDAARYIARLHRNNASPPKTVELAYFSADIPPPEKGINANLPEHTKHKTFFVYAVQPEDLK